MDQADIARRVPAVLGALDQPLADPAVIPLHAVSELARRHVSVAVGGEGADELFGGYPRYRWLIRSPRSSACSPGVTPRWPRGPGFASARFGRRALG